MTLTIILFGVLGVIALKFYLDRLVAAENEKLFLEAVKEAQKAGQTVEIKEFPKLKLDMIDTSVMYRFVITEEGQTPFESLMYPSLEEAKRGFVFHHHLSINGKSIWSSTSL